MDRAELSRIVESARCRVIGHEDAGSAGHRDALAALVRAFDSSESAILCEPSLARKSARPPDLVLIDPRIGVHVLEVKGIALDQIEGLDAGGVLRIRYPSGVRPRSAIAQARSAMFDIKDAAARHYAHGELRIAFGFWVVFPSISREAWSERFGHHAFCPGEFLFCEDLEPSELARRMGAADASADDAVQLQPLDQLQCVWRAFGDSSVLYCTPEERAPRETTAGTLGEMFDEAAEAYKALSDEQQKLSSMHWESGPRLIRGVAGSGKTIVLANNLARRLQRSLTNATGTLFTPPPAPPRLLAVCFNRTLAPFIQKKINIAFQQRTGRLPPPQSVQVQSFNELMFRLSRAGLWRYQPIEGDRQNDQRGAQYLAELMDARRANPAFAHSLLYDAIYVDEGQDFTEIEFRILKELCRTTPGGEPSLFVFYDDAQNLYGRGRPNWQSLGLNIRGRSFVMTQCFRNTRPIVQASFNVLYGACASAPGQVPTRDFADISTLRDKGLISNDNGFWKILFAPRDGAAPAISFATNPRQETELIIARLRWLIQQQEVRPQDILVLAFTRRRATQLAEAIGKAGIPGVSHVHLAFKEKDKPLGQKGRLNLSTVHSAKGYDAYCVLLASANEFPTDITGRATFYVACTRAIEYLEVFGWHKSSLATEFEAVLAHR